MKGKLGEMYYKGQYVKQDFNEAFRLLKEAAEYKDVPSGNAMRLLSACYRYGLGTEKDAQKEAYWMEEAAKFKDEKAVGIVGN